jgi:hypothetical protein
MIRKVTVYASLCVGGLAMFAQSSPSVGLKPPTLGLLRANGGSKPGEVAFLTSDKFSIDPLSTSGAPGASKSAKNNVDYLALDANKSWLESLRGSSRDPTYASFVVHTSQATVIDIGGARLGVTASPLTGDVQLMYDDPTNGTLTWQPLNYHFPLASYGGKPMAAVPVLTVALDPAAGVWHLYGGSRLIADHLPLIPATKDSGKFTLTAGHDGAWLCGLVLADENPLYEDANHNGIDDAFERTQNGGALLAETASLRVRQLLAQQWKAAQRTHPPPGLFVQHPLPDGK